LERSILSDAHRIDVHHHFFPADYLAGVPSNAASAEARAWTLARSIEDMDRAQIATAVLSITNPGTWFGDDAGARRLARMCNDEAAQLIADYPGRFRMFATLPLPDIAGSLTELAYALDVLHADGVAMYTNYQDRWLGDPLFAPVFEELDRRGALVYTHPSTNVCQLSVLPEIKQAAIEFGTDTTRTIASLLFSGAAARYARTRFIFSHAGGTMPFLIDRFVQLAELPALAGRLPHGLMAELQKFYYDTAQAANPTALRALTSLVDPSQVLFGSDYPYRTAADHVTGLHGCGFDAGELRAIECDNARRLLAP
jgi:predicted TIM-barrel fold metal-dependent hydrolase